MTDSAAQTKAIDMHLHIVGNGLSGSGCWVNVSGPHRALASFMLKHIGLTVGLNSPQFDNTYVENVLRMLRGSSIGCAVILGQDNVYDENGAIMKGAGTFYVPNDFVLKLAREHAEFLPAVSIHPARKDAIDELDRCVEAGAVMMKCLPNCHNIDCSNPRYKKFWDRMAHHRLPLLAHTGGEHTVKVINKKYSDPRILRLPLECGVNVIAAHCATKSGLTDPDYFPVLAEMMKRHTNLYGDNSAMNVPLRGKHIPECITEPMASRVVFGTDFPVPVSGYWGRLRGFLDKETQKKWDKHPNVLERDYQLKKAMGFPAASFTRIWSLLRLTSRAPRH
ncbi:MAG: amidohydrolase family protein [Limisphaerales bacterium]